MNSIPPKTLGIQRDTSGQDRLLERGSAWQRYRTRTVITLSALAAAVVLGLFVAKFTGIGTSVDRDRLSIATVERGTFVRDVAADGQVIATVSPTLYADAAGTIALEVHAGDTVVKDQLLAVIDSPDLTAKVAQEEATLQGLRIDWQRAQLDAEHRLSSVHDTYAQAQVDDKTARREAERSHKAYEMGAYSELQAQRAADALEKAQFVLRQAQLVYDAQPKQNHFDVDSKKSLFDRQQAVVTELHRQLDRLNIESPVAGQVGQVQVADRASVAKDSPLLTVVDLSALEVEIKVAENLARDLRPGMAADLQGDGHHWQGTVSGISPEVVNGQIAARVRFDTGPAGLRQSQRVSVRILIDRRNNVLMVDRGTFVDQLGGGYAYVVHDNVAERRPVHLGAASVAKVEVLSGLNVGDAIVASGAETFNNADRAALSH